jgi:hypothetical protein
MDDEKVVVVLLRFIFNCFRVLHIMTHPLPFLVIMGVVIAASVAVRVVRRLRNAQRSREDTR